MDDVQQMIVNEVKRLERIVEKRAKTLAQLEAKVQQRTAPRRYVLEFDVPASSAISGATYRPLTRSFVVDKDSSRFFCQDVVFSVAAVGEITGVTNSNKMTLSPQWQGTLDFTWRIRDTATDREWQNVPLPRYFLASGLTAGLPLPWSAALRPGAEIETTIVPTQVRSTISGFNSVTSYTLQIAFVGFEVL
jgi:hypothetical protein